MTVKTLTDVQKDAIVTIYNSKTKTIVDMAKHLGVSPRTVGRVLVEKGLATPVPRLKGEAHQVLRTLEAWGIAPKELQKFMETLEFANVLTLKDGKVTGVQIPPVERSHIMKACIRMEDGTWAALLADIIHLREARKHNSSVSNAMLQLQNKANKDHG